VAVDFKTQGGMYAEEETRNADFQTFVGNLKLMMRADFTDKRAPVVRKQLVGEFAGYLKVLARTHKHAPAAEDGVEYKMLLR
jgi:hypothetical protein